MSNFKQPEILYQESLEGISGGMPFMNIENIQEVPKVLFIGSAINSNDVNEDGEQIVDFIVNSYYNSNDIKNILSVTEYDKLRKGLGLIKE